MDFVIIKKKINSKKYKNVHEFSKDIRQIWCNAMKFNQINEIIWINAYKLSKYYEKRFLNEVIPLVGSKKLNKIFYNILEDILVIREAKEFIEPVNYIIFYFPSYNKLIKKPLCLKQIKDKIWSYKSSKDFLRDVNLVFNNVLGFNAKENSIKIISKKLKNLTHKMLRQIIKENNLKDKTIYKKEFKFFKYITRDEKQWMIKQIYNLDEEHIFPLIKILMEYNKKGFLKKFNLNSLPINILLEYFYYFKKSLEIQKKVEKEMEY